MSSVTLQSSATDIRPSDMDGFFHGWAASPTLSQRIAILQSADEVVLAKDSDQSIVGFATAVTDRKFTGFIALVEVLPSHQRLGIGTRMVKELLARLAYCYMIDVVCDDALMPFYERLGGTPLRAVGWRNYNQIRADI